MQAAKSPIVSFKKSKRAGATKWTGHLQLKTSLTINKSKSGEQMAWVFYTRMKGYFLTKLFCRVDEEVNLMRVKFPPWRDNDADGLRVSSSVWQRLVSVVSFFLHPQSPQKRLPDFNSNLPKIQIYWKWGSGITQGIIKLHWIYQWDEIGR